MRPATSVLAALCVLSVATACRGEPEPALAPEASPSLAPTLSPAAPTPQELALTVPYAEPEGLWGLGYIPSTLRLQARDGRWVRFAGPGGAVAAVESYVGRAGDYGDSGEGLRERAREALAELFEGAQETGTIAPPPGAFWEAGIAFAAAGGARGEALYAQPGRYEGDYRVYGFLLACPAKVEDTLRRELEAMRESFRPVSVLALQVARTDEQLWVADSHGFRGFGEGPGQGHWLALYTRDGAGYRQVASALLESPDYVHPSGVRQVFLGGGDPPTRLWLEVESGVGAHGGCYDLFMYDWQRLVHRVSHCHSSPGAGEVSDVDGDGVLEVILDESDEYVFCYACGVRYSASRVLRCDEQGCAEVELAALPEAAPDDLRRLNDRAVALARAGLWKDAEAAIQQALALGVYEPALATNAALIRLHAEAFQRQVREGGYPLLAHVFYGDYEAALGLMRSFKPEELWGPDSALVRGTMAEGYEASLAEWLTRVTTRALEAEPSLAAAHFLRGWAAHLLDRESLQAVEDVKRAAELEPGEGLFVESLAYLEVK